MPARKRSPEEKRKERLRWKRTGGRRAAQVYRALKNQPCRDCGVQYPPHVMQFDHLPEHRKRRDVSDLSTTGQILREAAKCEVVCANCHAERTFQRLVRARTGTSAGETRRPEQGLFDLT